MKKFLFFSLFSCSFLFANSSQDSEIYPGGFFLGSTGYTSVNRFEPFLSVGYINSSFLINFGTNYYHITLPQANNEGLDFFTFLLEVGGRERLYSNLFATYGLAGSIDVVVQGPSPFDEDEYGLAVFGGLDLQITRHFLLSSKLYPFEYIKDFIKQKFYRVFAAGSLGLSYVF